MRMFRLKAEMIDWSYNLWKSFKQFMRYSYSKSEGFENCLQFHYIYLSIIIIILVRQPWVLTVFLSITVWPTVCAKPLGELSVVIHFKQTLSNDFTKLVVYVCHVSKSKYFKKSFSPIRKGSAEKGHKKLVKTQ